MLFQIGSFIALASLVSSSFMAILSRRIREVQYTLVLIMIGLVGMSESVAIVTIKDGFTMTSGLHDTLILAGLAMVSFFGQLCVVLGSKFEQAGPVALIRNCDAVFGFLGQFLFLGVVPGKFRYLQKLLQLYKSARA